MSMVITAELNISNNPDLAVFPDNIWLVVPSLDGGFFNPWDTVASINGGSFWSGGDSFDSGCLRAVPNNPDLSVVTITPDIIIV